MDDPRRADDLEVRLQVLRREEGVRAGDDYDAVLPGLRDDDDRHARASRTGCDAGRVDARAHQAGPQLRCKGIVGFAGDPKRFVFQGVHMMLDGEPQRAWKPGEKRESKVVFIGRDLREEDIRKGFLACAV